MLDRNEVAERLYNNFIKMNEAIEECPNSKYFVSKELYCDDNVRMGFKEGVKLALLILLGQ